MPGSGERNGVVENDEQELAAYIPVRCVQQESVIGTAGIHGTLLQPVRLKKQ
jgi:hypothetical protein